MAKIVRNDLSRIALKISRSKGDLLSPTFYKKTSTFMANMIRNRTRQDRKSVAKDGGNRTKLAGLHVKTKRIRRRYRKNLHKDTSSDISNLTATGKLLDGIRGAGNGKEIAVRLAKARGGSTLSGGRDKSNNHDVNEGQEAMGRPFMYVSKTELRELEQRVEDELDRQFKKLVK